MPTDEEFQQLQRLFEEHVLSCNQRDEEHRMQIERLITLQEAQAEAAHGLLEAWEAATGTVKALSALGSVVKWVAACVGLYLLFDKFG